MALDGKRVFTNTKFIDINNNAKAFFLLPNQDSPEYKKMLKNTWFIKCYHEAQRTWDCGGYILMITLTHRLDSVPHIGDFMDLQGKCFNYMCFNWKDVQDFWKRVKQEAHRKYHIDDRLLRYFCAGEYGTDPNRLHMPHYHLLVHCNDPMLDPVELSRIISRQWKLGLVDGRDEKGLLYFNRHVYGAGRADRVALNDAISYVTKYVVKDSDFQETIDARIDDVLKRTVKAGTLEYNEQRKRLMRYMAQNHKLSNNLGMYAVTDADTMESIYRDGTMPVPDKKVIKRFIPIPLYYQRKFFMETYRDDDGGLHWKWTDDGYQWKRKMTDVQVSRVAVKMHEWYENLNVYCKYVEDAVKTRERVDAYLAGRSWIDFADYLVYYKGTWCTDMNHIPSKNAVLYNRGHFNDQRVLEGKCMTNRKDVYKADTEEYVCSFDDLVAKYVINEDSDPRFRDFDKLYKLYFGMSIYWTKKRCEKYDFDLKSRVKWDYYKKYGCFPPESEIEQLRKIEEANVANIVRSTRPCELMDEADLDKFVNEVIERKKQKK